MWPVGFTTGRSCTGKGGHDFSQDHCTSSFGGCGERESRLGGQSPGAGVEHGHSGLLDSRRHSDKFAEAEGQRLLSSLLGAESQLLLILMALVCREA